MKRGSIITCTQQPKHSIQHFRFSTSISTQAPKSAPKALKQAPNQAPQAPRLQNHLETPPKAPDSPLTSAPKHPKTGAAPRQRRLGLLSPKSASLSCQSTQYTARYHPNRRQYGVNLQPNIRPGAHLSVDCAACEEVETDVDDEEAIHQTVQHEDDGVRLRRHLEPGAYTRPLFSST
jgi:hypothetical protein